MTDTASPRLSQRWKWASQQAISYLMQQGIENPDVLSLAAGFVDQQTLPIDATRQAFESLMADEERARSVLQYGTTTGSEELRNKLLEHLAELEGCDVSKLKIDASQLVITTGSQQLLALLGDILFDPGDICLVAAPTYFVFLSVLDGVGATAITVETDQDGMRTDALNEQLQQLERAGQLDRVKMIYLVSYYENPSGVSLAEERRAEVVEIANRWSKSHQIYVLEDAAYRELRYDGPVLPSVWGCDDDRETVVLTQTFSKSFAPGLRVGYGVLPKALVGPVCDCKGNRDFGSANLNQNILIHVFNQNLYHSHVDSLRESYKVKRDAMLNAADKYCTDIDGVEWLHPHGGLYVWMKTPETMPTGFESPLFQTAVHDEKVMFVPGELCYAGPIDDRPKNRMRLSYGVLTPEKIDDGIKRLANAIRSLA